MEFCPTLDMIRDYFMKALKISQFFAFVISILVSINIKLARADKNGCGRIYNDYHI